MEPESNSTNQEQQPAETSTSHHQNNPHTPKRINNQSQSTSKRKRPAKTINRKTIEALFPAKYIEHGLNGTKAYQAIRPHSPSESAKVEASRILTKPNVQEALMDLLKEHKLKVGDIVKIHKRNMEQVEDLSTSQRAVQDGYKLYGLLNSEKQGTTVNIALITKDQ